MMILDLQEIVRKIMGKRVHLRCTVFLLKKYFILFVSYSPLFLFFLLSSILSCEGFS